MHFQIDFSQAVRIGAHIEKPTTTLSALESNDNQQRKKAKVTL